jgi:hypothetical protein
MTLVWLAFILAVIVWALVFIAWDIRTTFRKAFRYATVDNYRHQRLAEDLAWAEFRAEADERRLGLERALRSDGAIDRLRALIDEYTPASSQPLRVVA